MGKLVEEWRDIQGYEGLYQVSDWGNVKSLKRPRVKKDRILKCSLDKDGYVRVDLSKDNKSKTKKVHKLVAIAFIPNPDNLPVINHIDENKENNCVWNLEWCDVEYNNNYGSRNGNFKKVVYKYTLEGEFVEKYESTIEAAKSVNGKASNVSACCRGFNFDKKRNKPHMCLKYKGYKWSYEPL